MNKKKRTVKYLSVIITTIFICTVILYGFKIGQKKPERIICITKNIDRSFEFWNDIMNGAELAAAEYGAELSIRGVEQEDDYEGQNLLILDAVKEKPDAIVLAAVDYNKTYKAARKITENHIKLVLIDSKLKDNIAGSVISTENFQAGIKMGAIIQKILKKDGRVGIISYVKDSSTAIDREEGIRTALRNVEEKVMDTVYGDSDYEKSKDVTKDLLLRHPQITILAALNQYSAVGAGRAVKELGLEDKVKIVGFDNAQEEIKYLEAGIFEAIVIQKPFNMGYLGVENAIKLVRGETVPFSVDSGSILITKENMYTDMNQKLLFPFRNE